MLGEVESIWETTLHFSENRSSMFPRAPGRARVGQVFRKKLDELEIRVLYQEFSIQSAVAHLAYRPLIL